ncbi:hypothetical protein [Achromobacter xylosoxidans]|uniref:hypothetical protein n=1 Tax=Alcaligenes xylosoxydans xylosoxydans TaxID=85698 RepID=UPI00211B26B7|nr:hypothetical protein [Achromobacter xylosoxidans]
MTKVLILGASGQIARWVVQMLGERKNIEQTRWCAIPGSSPALNPPTPGSPSAM